jgi:hypothetical protein
VPKHTNTLKPENLTILYSSHGGVDMPEDTETTRKPHDNDAEMNQRYANHLEFLWEQYNKLMGLGIIASAATLAFLLQGILFNKDIVEILTKVPLKTNWLIAAIISAGSAALLFIAARWCSQILMERQIYGKHSDAVKYFESTLENETILPTALQPKPYMNWVNRKLLLKLLGNLNEFAKWMGIVLILLSWLSSFIFAWPLIESFRLIKP